MGIFSDTIPSAPNLSTYSGFPSDQDDWNCSQWIAYYKNCKKFYGQDKAISIISIDAENSSIFADVNACKYDCNFVKYFESEGFGSVGNIFSKTFCTADKAVDVVKDAVTTAETVVDSVGNVGDTLAIVTKPKILIALAILGGFVYYQYKKPTFKRRTK